MARPAATAAVRMNLQTHERNKNACLRIDLSPPFPVNPLHMIASVYKGAIRSKTAEFVPLLRYFHSAYALTENR